MFASVQGAERFSDNIEDMIGYKPLSLIRYCWRFSTPLICSVRVHTPLKGALDLLFSPVISSHFSLVPCTGHPRIPGPEIFSPEVQQLVRVPMVGILHRLVPGTVVPRTDSWDHGRQADQE